MKCSDIISRDKNNERSKVMIFTINNHLGLNHNTATKQTYIDNYDKSVKMPFVKVMINNLPHFKTFHADEVKLDNSELAISDNIELSSAITGAVSISEPNAGGTGQLYSN